MGDGRNPVYMRNSFKLIGIITFSVVATVLLRPLPISASELYDTTTLPNGISIRISTPERVLTFCTERDHLGRLIFRVPGGDSYIFIEDPSDPSIVNRGDGRFHPMNEESVVRALETIDLDGRSIGCELYIYILPYPRYGFPASTAAGNCIFLSPGVYEVSSCVISFIVTHEFGHVFQHLHLDDSDTERWETYLRLRGIYGDPAYSETAQHRNRPKEIFAEDFRYLFGGDESRYSNSIENPYLALPDQVYGLEEFMVSLVAPAMAALNVKDVPTPGRTPAASNYPNPFNPSTTIEVSFPETGEGNRRSVELDVYGADGSLVRSLYRGEATGPVFRATWDGRDRTGRDVPSGVYFYRFRSGPDFVTGKMLLIR
jgi:hypothetical protein